MSSIETLDERARRIGAGLARLQADADAYWSSARCVLSTDAERAAYADRELHRRGYITNKGAGLPKYQGIAA